MYELQRTSVKGGHLLNAIVNQVKNEMVFLLWVLPYFELLKGFKAQLRRLINLSLPRTGVAFLSPDRGAPARPDNCARGRRPSARVKRR